MEENNMLDKEFKDLVLFVKQDILKTRFEVQENANTELIKLYYRMGKIVSENAKYGNKFIQDFSKMLKKGYSSKNIVSDFNKFLEDRSQLESRYNNMEGIQSWEFSGLWDEFIGD